MKPQQQHAVSPSQQCCGEAANNHTWLLQGLKQALCCISFQGGGEVVKSVVLLGAATMCFIHVHTRLQHTHPSTHTHQPT